MMRPSGIQPRARILPIEDTTAWERLLAQSENETAILFKHDPYCGTSAAAYEQVMALDADVAILDVAAHNDVARLIARQTGIRHESPQVIVLRGGKAAWSASHWAITADKVGEAAR